MPKVMIEMEMPKSCIDCRFCRWADWKSMWACYAMEPVKCMSSKNYEAEKKMRGCPLQEVKE